MVFMSNKPALAATVIVALLAIAAVYVAFAKLPRNSGDSGNVPEESAGFRPSEELENEIYDATERLVRDNYAVLRLFYTAGTEHKDEPYGNPPEDGYYTAITDYTSVEQIFALVDGTFADAEASRIKETGVYKDKKGAVGISETFEKIPYDINWENPDVVIDFVSETECGITITLKSGSEDIQFETNMLKGNGGVWRLEKLMGLIQ